LEQVGEATAFHPPALRWDGKNWLQTEPAIPDGRLDDVLVRSANDVWAVGATELAGEEPIRPVLQHWTGTAWSLIDTPLAPPGEYAQFTTVAAQGDDLLIGQYGDQSSVHRYADGVWQELPREGLEHIVYLDDLEVVSDKEVWAAGLGGLARYDGVRWTKVDLPVEQPEDRQFEVAQLVVRSADDIWAVGPETEPGTVASTARPSLRRQDLDRDRRTSGHRRVPRPRIHRRQACRHRRQPGDR
jgi:hypothetical protein